jgi:hypothetical protein
VQLQHLSVLDLLQWMQMMAEAGLFGIGHVKEAQIIP